MAYSPERVVLVANIKKIPDKGYAKHMSSFDVSKRFTNWMLGRAIRKNGYKLVVYDSLDGFINNIQTHRNDLVFPYYFGVGSKIRQSYVQSICETQNIRFVGADAYAHTIGNDKALSKEICRYAGIDTPICKTLFDINYPPDLSVLTLPLIVKPQFEGDSIGISDANVFSTLEGVFPFAEKLLKDLSQPILIEEFIEGREFSVCMIGYKREIKKIAALEDISKKEKVFSYKAKKFKLHFDRLRDVMDLLTQEMINKMSSLFHSLDKLEYIRLDFIYANSKYYNIELTADVDLSPYSFMYNAFKKDMTYTQFIDFLISNCLERYKLIEENG